MKHLSVKEDAAHFPALDGAFSICVTSKKIDFFHLVVVNKGL